MTDAGNNKAPISEDKNNNQLSNSSSNSISAFGLNKIIESENKRLFNENLQVWKQVNKKMNSSINTAEDGLTPIKNNVSKT